MATNSLAQKGQADSQEGFSGVSIDLVEDDTLRQMTFENWTLRVTDRPSEHDTVTPIFTLFHNDNQVMQFEGEPTYFDFLPVRVTLAQLDPDTPEPELVATSYTGGAHCCDRIQIAWVQAEGTWWLEEFGLYDGGFYLSDHNGDGVGEITVRDQSFLYTFDGYAGSWAPPQIFVLRDGEVLDVSADDGYASAFTEEIGDFIPEQNIERPGALAGWAAMRARLGHGEEAIERLRLANATVDWPYQVCLKGGSRFSCDEQYLRSFTFVEFLTRHLVEQGYLEAAP
ncbi:MAG: hypothetical protein AAF739_02300 [Pseudomonadota bacterium]